MQFTPPQKPSFHSQGKQTFPLSASKVRKFGSYPTDWNLIF